MWFDRVYSQFCILIFWKTYLQMRGLRFGDTSFYYGVLASSERVAFNIKKTNQHTFWMRGYDVFTDGIYAHFLMCVGETS